MPVKVAKTAGFCFGVNRAVTLIYKLLQENKKVATLGPIIHNPAVVGDLNDKGVIIINSAEDTPTGYTLVIRSHGVPAEVLRKIKEMQIPYVDATCPYVTKIHNIVREASRKGTPVMIAGDKTHPEVVGIKGHCESCAYAFSDEQELLRLTEQFPELTQKATTIVAQTTFNHNLWDKCKKILKKLYTNPIVFDTICNATIERQREAEALSRTSDIMLIVGGRESSNTAKLYDICSKNCETYFIEQADELPFNYINPAKCIALTAGASTPAGIIKEVFKTMSEIVKDDLTAVPEEDESLDNNQEVKADAAPMEDVSADAPDLQAESEEKSPPEKVEEAVVESEPVVQKSFDEMTFEEALEASLNSLNIEQKVRGVVMSIAPTEVQVDIGRKHAGFIPNDEFSNDPNVRPADVLEVGDELDLIVMRTNDIEGTVMLSKRRYDSRLGWEKIVAAKDSEEAVEGTITEVIKGGVMAVAHGVRIFVPASQASLARGADLTPLVGQKYNINILEINRGRRVIGSIKKALREERKAAEQAFWDSVENGKTYVGTVKSLTSYGAFVDLGGVDGMIHISELSWGRIKDPSEVVNVGDTVEVYIKDINDEKKKISLGYRKQQDNPWEILARDYKVGTTVPVRVVSMTTYGAFANIIPGVDGLIHISQIADRRIDKPQDVLKVGDNVNTKITDIDLERKRVSLSIRALLEDDDMDYGSDNAEAPAPAEKAVEESVAVEEEISEAAPVEVEAAEPASETAEQAPEIAAENPVEELTAEAESE